jgi:shikimate dehydrogenase
MIPPVDGAGTAPGAGRRAAVLGHPISHSKSPALHAAANRVLGLDWSYGIVDVPVERLAEFLAGTRADGNWYGLSVTMPLKNAIVPLLDHVAGPAAALGAVNTVTFRADPAHGGPQLTGHNTDVAGLVGALRHAGVRPEPRSAVLGGGGTASAAVAAFAALGAPAVDVYVRNPSKAAGLPAIAADAGLSCRLLPWADAAAAVTGYDAVIATLPPQGADELAAALPATKPVRAGSLLLDAAYDPWPSSLARAWKTSGGQSVSGLEMLLYQAVEQVRLFTGDAFERPDDVLNAMCDAIGLARR